MTHRTESILWSSIIAVVMLIFLYLSFSLRFGAMYARVTIVATLSFALISLILSLRQKEPEKTTYSEEELENMEVAERAHALEVMEEGRTPFLSADLLLVIAVSFASALLWEPVSFVYAGFLALLVLFLVKRQPVLKSLIVAAATICIIQYVFGNIFQIPLPSPSWWSIY